MFDVRSERRVTALRAETQSEYFPLQDDTMRRFRLAALRDEQGRAVSTVSIDQIQSTSRADSEANQGDGDNNWRSRRKDMGAETT